MMYKIFDNKLVALCKTKHVLKVSKSASAGMCILELGKILMCKFHYHHIKNKYDKKSKLLFTDTDDL